MDYYNGFCIFLLNIAKKFIKERIIDGNKMKINEWILYIFIPDQQIIKMIGKTLYK